MFKTERIVEFGMCDSAGILFFANIFNLTHSAYEEFILRSDLKDNYFESEYFAIPLINTSAEFHKPIRLHEILEVKLRVTNIGDSSFQLLITFTNQKGELKATTKTSHVFVSKKEFSKINIPDEFISLLEENKN